MERRKLGLFIYFTVFTSSMAIMFLQLVAGRIIAQYVGQSLLTWTSIIATTLAGISVGNRLGGILADRFSNLKTLPLIFLVSSVLVVSILLINTLLGNFQFLIDLPWSLRILTHVVLLFFPSFTVLGTVSPVLTRLLLKIYPKSGGCVGIFFGFSLLGSLIGTFSTGYFLLAYFPYDVLILISGLILFSISVTYFLLVIFVKGSIDIEKNTLHDDVLSDSKQSVQKRGQDYYVPLWVLLLLSFWTGLGIMAVEIVAGRLLAKNFGNSLYTWTTNIGIILAGLSVGGYIGGYLSQRVDIKKLVVVILFFCSLFTLIIPLLNTILPWLPFIWNFSWPNQILIHTIIVFGPCSLVFGMVIPTLVSILSKQVENSLLGSKVGLLYSMNALGSILGVLLTGFYTIAHWGSGLTLAVVSCVTSVSMLLIIYKSIWIIPYVCLLVLVLVSSIAPYSPWDSLAIQLAIKSYKSPEILYEKESQYNYILVRTPVPERPHIRDLVLDKMIHNSIDLHNPFYLWGKYERLFYTAIRIAMKEQDPKRVFVIGGGGYTFCHFLEKEFPSTVIEVAEIDPEVTETAHLVFGLPRDTTLSIYHQDGRNCIEDLYRKKRKGMLSHSYDCIINDSFSDYTVPFHLTTKEFVQKIFDLLSEKGIYLCNIIESLGNAQFLASMYHTFESVFPYVSLFNTTQDPQIRDTFVMVGSKQPISEEEFIRWIEEKYQEKYFYVSKSKIQTLIGNKKRFLLSDRFAPVEHLLAPMVVSTEDTPYLRRIAKAEQKLRKGKAETVIQEMLEIIQEKPYIIKAYILLSEALIQVGRYTESIVWAKKVVERAPSLLSGYVPLAVAYIKLGNYPLAIETYEKIVKLDPYYIEAKVNLSSLYIRQNELDKAEQLLQNLVDVGNDKTRVEANINLATISFLRNNYLQALRYLLTAEKIQPDNYFIKEQLAIIYLQLGDVKNDQQKIDECRKAGHPISLDISSSSN